MAKKVEEGTTPRVSKYAAKKAARIAANAEVNSDNTEIASDGEESFEETQEAVNNKPAKPSKKSKGGAVVGKDNRELGIDIPQHVIDIAYILKDNAGIRRHCSLNILNYLTQKGRIPAEAKGKYVKFLWNKFRVSANGLTSEFYYTEDFFLKSLVASFNQFAKDAQNAISVFINGEGLDVAFDSDSEK